MELKGTIRVTSFLLGIFILLFCFIGCVTENWARPLYYHNKTIVVYTAGLWKICHTYDLTKYQCAHSFSPESAAVRAARAFMVLCLSCCVVNVVIGIYKLIARNPLNIPIALVYLVSIILDITIGFCCIIAYAVYLGSIKDILNLGDRSTLEKGTGYSANLVFVAGWLSIGVSTALDVRLGYHLAMEEAKNAEFVWVNRRDIPKQDNQNRA